MVLWLQDNWGEREQRKYFSIFGKLDVPKTYCHIKGQERVFFLLAGRPGFEPGLTESESVVLPLDDLPKLFLLTI